MPAKRQSARTPFARFEDEVLAVLGRLGIRGRWDVRFAEDPDLPDDAQIAADPRTRLAVFTFGRASDGMTVERLARHEAAHLLIADLAWLAEQRYASEDDVDRAGEEICTVLERVL